MEKCVNRKLSPKDFFCEDRTIRVKLKKRTQFIIIRNMLKLHYKCGDISVLTYEAMIDLLDKEDERMALESEE